MSIKVPWTSVAPAWKFALEPRLKRALIAIRDDAKTGKGDHQTDFGMPRKLPSAKTSVHHTTETPSLTTNVYHNAPFVNTEGSRQAVPVAEPIKHAIKQFKLKLDFDKTQLSQYAFLATLLSLAGYYTLSVIRLKYGLSFEETPRNSRY